MRRFTVAALLALTLIVGLVVGAWADIPDTQPNAPDPAHVIYGCYYPANSTTPLRSFQILDKSLGNCPNGWAELRFVPAIPPQTP